MPHTSAAVREATALWPLTFRDPRTGVVPTVPEGMKPDPLKPETMAYNPMGETRLWNAVILQAVQDASFPGHVPTMPTENTPAPSLTPTQKESLEAMQWLLGDSEEFSRICNRAGARTYHIRAKVRQLLTPMLPVLEAASATWKARAEAVTGRATSAPRTNARLYAEVVALIKRGD